MNKTWIKCMAIRALKTFCQCFVATIGTAQILSEVDFKMVLSASVLAAILSCMTSLAGLPEVEADHADVEEEAEAAEYGIHN